MATVQIMAFITLDGYLVQKDTFPDLWEHPDKYELSHIRERAIARLDPSAPFVKLTKWKQDNKGVYLVEAMPETLRFMESLLRFRMADELILYVLPYFQGEGTRLFEGIAGLSSKWKLVETRSFYKNIQRLHYKRIVGM